MSRWDWCIQVCTAIWDSQSANQNAGEASSAQLLMLNASSLGPDLDPLFLTAPSPDPGLKRRSLLATAAATGPVVECDGRIQVDTHSCLSDAQNCSVGPPTSEVPRLSGMSTSASSCEPGTYYMHVLN